MKTFYLTTTLPYVNADPHIGFALELVQADTLARSKQLSGEEIFFNTGTDEHGIKIFRKAQELGMDTQAYCDMYAAKFNDLKSALNVSYNHFIRTTDPHHKAAAQEFWRRCDANGDIYKKTYQVKYCIGCELEKTDSELVDGKCPLHPNLVLEYINEENYFFRFSRYEQILLDIYKTDPHFVRPQSKLNEIVAFVERGLQDFSISRLRDKMPWGVPVPGDEEQVMYVWFDALVNYISTTGWPEDVTQFNKWWGTVSEPNGIQVAGKDNLRQQSAMWQAMLLSAKLPRSKQIFIHGFITSDGQKMSKSLGNVIDPFTVVNSYGTDAVRYYLLREIPSLDDGDFSLSRMKEIFETELANELGNLVTRLTNLGEKDGLEMQQESLPVSDAILEAIADYDFRKGIEIVWENVRGLNRAINETEPWKLSADERKGFLHDSLVTLYSIGINLQPFMPETAAKILSSTSGIIKKCPPLFPKKRD